MLMSCALAAIVNKSSARNFDWNRQMQQQLPVEIDDRKEWK